MSSQDISVPHGPERQRILNVLAQRRYRQRKRERLQALEARLNSKTSGSNVTYAAVEEMPLQHSMQPPLPRLDNPETPDESLYDLYSDNVTGASNASYMYLSPYESACNASNSSSSQVTHQFGISSLLTNGSSSFCASSTSDSHLSIELQDLETAQFTFPSEHAIDIPSFKSMEVALRIAQMLGLTDEFLDITLSRVLDVSKISVPLEDLPGNLRPTEAQLTIPHYPVIDVLPWPSLRNRLICLFHQPDQLRPPIARGSMAIMRLIHSFDDESEGCRIALDGNGHGFDGTSWEIGQVIFKDWWWTLDSEIVSNSNRLRRLRGASRLQL
ncbi:hypothetical protein T440DRAFT_463934 [Plenodomus tracheiphilus IPT5]|uniref:KaiA N-terminal domain-containing protein n=1 Tax=Plenodomus tracheiphilus IPT5 TaxID=1408161 RepID=A0A6A7BJ94_9PLEO|nr:hypothetical protein T440DRAFT_463934 [Plenodomus tracheiphilus IPT5]